MVSSAELRAVTNAARAKYGCAAEKIQQKITKHLQRGENECMDMFMDLTIKIPSKIVSGCLFLTK
jgi:hypothetical protein